MTFPTPKTRITTETLITQDLGYCCAWVFFRRFRSVATIALRLGMDPRTVRLWKAKFKAGELSCGNHCNCMKEKLK